jgi:WD40 repeat protein
MVVTNKLLLFSIKFINLISRLQILICLFATLFPCHVVTAQHFKLSATFSDLNSPVTCMALSPDGKLLITGDSTGTVGFRDPETGKIINAEKAFHTSIENICFNSTGKLMIVHTQEGEIKIYDFVSHSFIQSLYSPDYSDMRFALFSIADGFIYFNGQGRLYKTRSDLSQQAVKLFEFDSVITNAVITEDRGALIFTCNNTLKVLNTRTDNLIQELNPSAAKIERLAISADNRIVTWSNDGTISLRKFELNQLSAQPIIWFKAGTPSRLAFSRDGNMMVTGNVGTWARIWKPFDKSVSQELFGHKDMVTNFVFSADEKSLLTSANDKTIRIWKEEPEEKKMTNTPLTEEKPKEILTPDPLPPAPEKDSLLPNVELDNNNVPVHLGGRKVNKTTVVEIDQPTVDVFVFDNASPDGDVMSLLFRNEWILKHHEVTKKKYKITLQLKPGVNNFLVLFADNLGKTPPNTAAISFVKNKQERIFRLISDLQSCSAINFIYKTTK